MNVSHMRNGVGPKTKGNFGVMEHGGHTHLHCAEKSFHCAILVVSVRGGKTLNNIQTFAFFLKFAVCEDFFGVSLNYLNFRVVAGEEENLVAVAAY